VRQRLSWSTPVAVTTSAAILIIAIDWHHIWRMVAKYPAVATILLFVMTQLIAFVAEVRNNFVQRSRIAAGLLDEIHRNLSANADGNLNPVAVQEMKDAVAKDDKVRPMVVVVYQDNFYSGICRDLPLISTAQVKAVNDFYFSTLQLKAVADAIERDTFFRISVAGRQSLFDDLLQAYGETVKSGELAMAALKERTGLGRFLS
jgi:hypothetical protein